MRGEHFHNRAAGIAALADGEPERKSAIDHARSCASCANALAEGEQVLVLLNALGPPPPPSREVLEQTSRAILTELYLEVPPKARLLPATFVVVSAVLFTWIAKHRTHHAEAWVESGGAIVIAFGCAALATHWRRISLLMTLLTSATLVAIAASGGRMEAIIGIKCLVMELVAAVLPYAALAYVAIVHRWSGGAGIYAATAVAGALSGHAALHLTCPARVATPHLVAFHFGGVLLAGILGALGGVPIARRAAQSQ